jgi:hypothetical protein
MLSDGRDVQPSIGREARLYVALDGALRGVKTLVSELGKRGPVAAQCIGAASITYGVGLAFGLAVSLMVLGVALVSVGTLAELKGGK